MTFVCKAYTITQLGPFYCFVLKTIYLYFIDLNIFSWFTKSQSIKFIQSMSNSHTKFVSFIILFAQFCLSRFYGQKQKAGKCWEEGRIYGHNFHTNRFFNVQVYRIKLSETFISTEYLMMVFYSILFLFWNFNVQKSRCRTVDLSKWWNDDRPI